MNQDLIEKLESELNAVGEKYIGCNMVDGTIIHYRDSLQAVLEKYKVDMQVTIRETSPGEYVVNIVKPEQEDLE